MLLKENLQTQILLEKADNVINNQLEKLKKKKPKRINSKKAEEKKMILIRKREKK